MTEPIRDALEEFGGRCPRCDEEPTDAHARGSEIVLVPCGHAITAMSALEVPPEELDDT